MTIAPFVEDPEENRIYFRKLRQLAVDIGNKNIDNVSMSILSMGMTGDYTVAGKVLQSSESEPVFSESEITVRRYKEYFKKILIKETRKHGCNG